MNKIFLDCEFNGFGGPLISLALAPRDRAIQPLYVVVEHGPVGDWAKQNIIPVLGDVPHVSREFAARQVAQYLRHWFTDPVIVADWPEDFINLLGLFLIRPGIMVAVPDFTMEYCSLAGFTTAQHSKVPHNALEDAISLRDYYETLEK